MHQFDPDLCNRSGLMHLMTDWSADRFQIHRFTTPIALSAQLQTPIFEVQDVSTILCKLFANKNCLHFSANKIVRKQMDANNANNFSKHICIKVEIFWVKWLNFQWNHLQKTIIWPKIIISKFICIKWYQKMRGKSQGIHNT